MDQTEQSVPHVYILNKLKQTRLLLVLMAQTPTSIKRQLHGHMLEGKVGTIISPCHTSKYLPTSTDWCSVSKFSLLDQLLARADETPSQVCRMSFSSFWDLSAKAVEQPLP